MRGTKQDGSFKDEKVRCAEGVAVETVFGRGHEVWDVHTDKQRWWVATEPTAPTPLSRMRPQAPAAFGKPGEGRGGVTAPTHEPVDVHEKGPLGSRGCGLAPRRSAH